MESTSGDVFTAFPAWKMDFGSVLCSMCVSPSAWYLAVLGAELDPSHGSNHVVHEAVVEDCRGLVRDSSGNRGQQAPECDYSVLGSKEFFAYFVLACFYNPSLGEY